MVFSYLILDPCVWIEAFLQDIYREVSVFYVF